MDAIGTVVQYLRSSQNLLFITGAGLSADSGLPTYRGPGGLYAQAATAEGVPVEEALSIERFRRQPELTWKYLLQLETACRQATPNRGHQVIAEMESHFARVWVLTQNIDGLHQAAGSRQVIDIHGDLHALKCTRCAYAAQVLTYAELTGWPPQCPHCHAVLRPQVVLFNEPLPGDKLAQLELEWSRGFDLIFSVGTTSVFPYIAAPVLWARRQGIPTVEIDPSRTAVTDSVDVKLAERAAPALTSIWERYRRAHMGSP